MATLGVAAPTYKPIFDEAEFKKRFPGGWGGSARETKSGFLADQVNRVLSSGETEARRIGAEEESRGQEMEDIVRGALPEANKPTLTDMDIRRAMTEQTDKAARRTNESMKMLRSQLGAAGEIGGGRAAGIASNIALQRRGMIVDARRSLFLEKAKQDAADRARNFQNSLTLASAVNRPVSMINMDWLQQALGLRLQQQAIEAGRSASKDLANAQQNAGVMSGVGSLLGAGIGLLGA